MWFKEKKQEKKITIDQKTVYSELKPQAKRYFHSFITI
jgi:hypothetical protein